MAIIELTPASIELTPAPERKTPKPEDPSALVGIGAGMMDFYQGAKQLGLGLLGQEEEQQAYTDKVKAERDFYNKGREAAGKGDDFDFARLVGNVATPLSLIPGGGSTVLRQAGLGALAGGAAAGTMFNPSNKAEDRITNTALGVGIGAPLGPAIPMALRAGTATVQNLTNKAGQYKRKILETTGNAVNKTINNLKIALENKGVIWENLSEEVQDRLTREGQEQLVVTGELDPDQLLRKLDIEDIVGSGGAMNAQITRNASDWTATENLSRIEANLPTAGEGVPTITSKKILQDDSMITYADSIADDIYDGAPPTDRSPTSFQATEKAKILLKNRSLELQNWVSEAYKVAKNTVGAQANLNRDKFAATVMETLQEFEGSVPASIVRRLEEFGINRTNISEGTKAFTVTEGDKLAKLINKLKNNNNDPTINAALNELSYSLRKSFDDLGNGGNEAAQKFRQAWSKASKRFDEIEVKQIKGLLNDKQDTSNFIKTRINGGNPKDIIKLKKSILASDGGKQVWNDLRAQVWSEISEQSGNETRAFSGNTLAKQLKKLGPERLEILFPDEMIKINTLLRGSTAMTVQPKFAAPNYSNTTTSALGQMLRQSAGAVPGGVAVRNLVDLGTNVVDPKRQQQQIAAQLRGDAVNQAQIDLAQKQKNKELVTQLMKGFRGTVPIAGASAVTNNEQ